MNPNIAAIATKNVPAMPTPSIVETGIFAAGSSRISCDTVTTVRCNRYILSTVAQRFKYFEQPMLFFDSLFRKQRIDQTLPWRDVVLGDLCFELARRQLVDALRQVCASKFPQSTVVKLPRPQFWK